MRNRAHPCVVSKFHAVYTPAGSAYHASPGRTEDCFCSLLSQACQHSQLHMHCDDVDVAIAQHLKLLNWHIRQSLGSVLPAARAAQSGRKVQQAC